MIIRFILGLLFIVVIILVTIIGCIIIVPLFIIDLILIPFDDNSDPLVKKFSDLWSKIFRIHKRRK